MGKLISWIEIPVTDFQRAVNFYQNVFNFELETKDSGEEKMAFFPGGEGVLFYKPGFTPSAAGVIINLDAGSRFDEAMSRISENGGKIIRQKTPVKSGGTGFFALFIDSEGNRLGLNGE